MSVNELVDAVYVLSVRSFTERIAHIRAEMARHGIDFEFIFDFDAAALEPDLIESRFAPSDLTRAQQSLVLKHIQSWRLCVERAARRVLVFEDDAVLSARFSDLLTAACAELDGRSPPYLLYLGCGDNKYVKGQRRSSTMLVSGGPLPATDAIIFDQEAARRRLAWVERNKITRPADWLLREVDAELGIPHFWLREPIVEQGSMNGLFDSVLDTKRIKRGRWAAGLRFRIERWWRRWYKAGASR